MLLQSRRNPGEQLVGTTGVVAAQNKPRDSSTNQPSSKKIPNLETSGTEVGVSQKSPDCQLVADSREVNEVEKPSGQESP